MGFGCARKVDVPGNEVGVNMGFGDVGDLQAFGFGGVEIGRHVAQRIDDQGCSGRVASDQVARLGEALVVQSFQVHRGSMLAGSRMVGNRQVSTNVRGPQ